MQVQAKTTYNNLEHDKEVIDRLVAENLTKKLDSYFQKNTHPDAETLISLNVRENDKRKFDGTLHVTFNGKPLHYAREDYKDLADLINHLFDHLKEELAGK